MKKKSFLLLVALFTLLSSSCKHKSYVTYLTKNDFTTKVIDYNKLDNLKYLGDKPCIVSFVSKKDSISRNVLPIIEEVADEFNGKIYVYIVNVDTEEELARGIGIMKIPCFMYFPMEGKPFSSSGVTTPKDETKLIFEGIVKKMLLKKKK